MTLRSVIAIKGGIMRKIGCRHDKSRRNQQFDTLLRFLRLSNSDEKIKAMAETLLTESEKAAIAQRLTIVRLLHRGEKYQDIASSLGVVPSTISKAADMYRKNGQYNKTFINMLNSFNYNPKNIEMEKTGNKDPQPKIITGGYREMMRKDKK